MDAARHRRSLATGSRRIGLRTEIGVWAPSPLADSELLSPPRVALSGARSPGAELSFSREDACSPKGGTGWKLRSPLHLLPQSCLRNVPMCRSVNRLSALLKTREMGFLLLPPRACLISHAWLLSLVPFPPNARVVTLSSCLCLDSARARILCLHPQGIWANMLPVRTW